MLDPQPPAAAWGSSRVTRGGDWRIPDRFCRSAHRSSYSQEDGEREVGFRVCTGPRSAVSGAGVSRPSLYTPHPHQRTPQRVNERRQRPHVVGQFLALVVQRLNLWLDRRIRPMFMAHFSALATSLAVRDTAAMTH